MSTSAAWGVLATNSDAPEEATQRPPFLALRGPSHSHPAALLHRRRRITPWQASSPASSAPFCPLPGRGGTGRGDRGEVGGLERPPVRPGEGPPPGQVADDEHPLAPAAVRCAVVRHVSIHVVLDLADGARGEGVGAGEAGVHDRARHVAAAGVVPELVHHEAHVAPEGGLRGLGNPVLVLAVPRVPRDRVAHDVHVGDP